MIKNYTADSIDFLKGLETIRKRPDMYVGATSGKQPDALYRLCREAVDNSMDEWLGGFNKQLYVFYNTKTFETTVLDNGRGIPVGWNAKAQQDSLTLVFTQLHAGGKFNHDVYKTSSGKNGIGQKAISALSKRLQVWSNNASDKKWHTQIFEKGEVKSEVLQQDPPAEYKKLIPATGTIVTWTPDPTIFKDSTELNVARLKHEIHDAQYLCPGLHFHIVIDGEETEYFSEDGLA
jgi:DNA gyrase subunit B